MMTPTKAAYVTRGAVRIHPTLFAAVEKDVLPGSGIAPEAFWTSLSSFLSRFADKNAALLKKRDAIQAQIDAYLLERRGKPLDPANYTRFLAEIGYLVPPAGPLNFQVETENVDAEVCKMAAPQLVVPVDNARYALNAANARWGSLLDAYYGTDAGPASTGDAVKTEAYNPKRGTKVFEYAHAFLNEFFPLSNNHKYNEVAEIQVDSRSSKTAKLLFKLQSGETATLDRDSQFVGYVPLPQLAPKTMEPKSVILLHNDLHVELVIDRASSIGSTHPAGLSDVLLEAAATAIADCEDSVAAVDAEDKALVYRNWAGLMKGTLVEQLTKTKTRSLRPDKRYLTRDGKTATLKGRALLFVRNVGIHMYTDAVVFAQNDAPVPEGLLDLMITAAAARHDVLPTTKAKDLLNSTKGSMYLVKPKMHGPEEVAYVMQTLEACEKELSLPNECIKLGIMDEERRTTVNLRECIRVAKRRCIFINTGFLDRTGDEIHTSFVYGPMMPKKEIEGALWRLSYEDWNVDIGLAVGLPRVGQIGKGMWAAPDAMAEMMKKKGAHPSAGATTAWVPSPTAATLHAIHYHQHSVKAAQARIRTQIDPFGAWGRAKLGDILTPPFLSKQLTKEEVRRELENNAQGMLGYVSRWVQLGVGCSKVPDIHDVGLMEDRATLRISSQHIANWLEHGLVSREEVVAAFEKMARVVDRQNEGSVGYTPMSADFASPYTGYQAALEMVWRGKQEANGLTERTLTEFRRLVKEKKPKGGKSKL